MKFRPRLELFVGTLLLLATFAIFHGVPQAPFHPDETSVLYQTRDLEGWLSNPGSLSWDPNRSGELEQTYRLLNPPLPKYILGVARRLAGYSVEKVSVDWNWSKSWDENLAAGAYPDKALLLAGRNASTVLSLLALLPLALSAKRIGGNSVAVFTVVLYLSNALFLVHGRRIMSEGTLLFSVSFGIFGILEAEKRPWLAGLGCAMAVCSKLSALPLLLAGFVATVWTTEPKSKLSLLHLRRIFIYLIVAVFIILLLNPILWSDPIKGIENIWQARADFTNRQIDLMEIVAPNYILDRPSERIAGMIYQLFIASPQTYEVGNYVKDIESSVEAYLANPFHSIGRGWAGGTIIMGLLLMGIVGVGLEFQAFGSGQRRDISLLFIATVLQLIALLWAIPIPFQRYYIPLLPLIILWSALGMDRVFYLIKKAADFSAA
jgi:4-amino-4-deoxy-L-arabinose transferase-like glycosyltransferase